MYSSTNLSFLVHYCYNGCEDKDGSNLSFWVSCFTCFRCVIYLSQRGESRMLEVCVLALLTLALPRDCGEDTKQTFWDCRRERGQTPAYSYTQDDRQTITTISHTFHTNQLGLIFAAFVGDIQKMFECDLASIWPEKKTCFTPSLPPRFYCFNAARGNKR